MSPLWALGGISAIVRLQKRASGYSRLCVVHTTDLARAVTFLAVVAMASAVVADRAAVLAALVCWQSTSLVLRMGNRGVRRVQSAPMWLSSAD
jgi:hypothetical protein